jgi:hypothetical protein
MALKTEARKPLYAVVGAGDLAVENIKDLPTQVVAQATTILPKTTAFVAELPGKAFSTYGTLISRGEKLVKSFRGNGTAKPAATPTKVTKPKA